MRSTEEKSSEASARRITTPQCHVGASGDIRTNADVTETFVSTVPRRVDKVSWRGIASQRIPGAALSHCL